MSQRSEILNTPGGHRDLRMVPTGSRCDHAHFRFGRPNVFGFDVENLPYLLEHVKQLVLIKESHHGCVKNRSCLHSDKAATTPYTLSVDDQVDSGEG